MEERNGITPNEAGIDNLVLNFDHRKLKGRIRECLGTDGEFASLLGISLASLSMKLRGCSEFKASEIVKICILLDISREELIDYFFPEVLFKQ